jgi:hypothetical protein
LGALKGTSNLITPVAAALFVTPSLYAAPPLLTRISNGCAPPELFTNSYTLPLARYRTGSLVV